MISSFLTGFFLGFSLILAIGAQNTFVLRQGIIGSHIFYVVLFCAFADAILIGIGIVGISFFFNDLIYESSDWLFSFSAFWLFGYGVLRLKTAIFSTNSITITEALSSKSLLSTISIIAILTFANPHVYLDTMVLIGTVSQQFYGLNRIAFGLGASLSSFAFFFSLGYGAKLLAPLMKNPYCWRLLDFLTAIVMFFISFKLAYAGNWF